MLRVHTVLKDTHLYILPSRIHTCTYCHQGYTLVHTVLKDTQLYILPSRIHTCTYCPQGYTLVHTALKDTHLYILPSRIHTSIWPLNAVYLRTNYILKFTVYPSIFIILMLQYKWAFLNNRLWFITNPKFKVQSFRFDRNLTLVQLTVVTAISNGRHHFVKHIFKQFISWRLKPPVTRCRFDWQTVENFRPSLVLPSSEWLKKSRKLMYFLY